MNASPTQHDSIVTHQNVITTGTNSPRTLEVNLRILSGPSLDSGVNLNTNDATLSTATGDLTSSVNLSKEKNIHCRCAKQLTPDKFLQEKRDKLPSDSNKQQTLPVPTFRSKGNSTKAVEEKVKVHTLTPVVFLPQEKLHTSTPPDLPTHDDLHILISAFNHGGRQGRSLCSLIFDTQNECREFHETNQTILSDKRR